MWRAERALGHPLWWAALLVLSVNDHLFKGAGVLPQPVVGKLSDFAGLLVAPALLAALLRVRDRRVFGALHLVVGAVFAGINVSPGLARGLEGLMAATPFPWAIYVDPTDLYALPMLWVSWRVLGAWCASPVALGALVARGGLALGSVACVATSPPPEPPPMLPQGAWGAFLVRNADSEEQVVRVRYLKDSVAVDCGAVLEAPAQVLNPDLFGPAEAYILEPDQVLGLREGNWCGVAIVDSLQPRLVAWEPREFPSTDLVPGQDTERVLDLRGGALVAHPSVGPVPEWTAEPEPACEMPDPGAGLGWTDTASGTWEVETVSVAPDGCVRVLFDGALGPWVVCAPGVDLPLGPGPLEIDVLPSRGSIVTPEELELRTERHRISLRRTLSEDAVVELEGCGGYHDACGSWVEPLGVRSNGGIVRRGTPLVEGSRTFHVVKAVRYRTLDADCEPWAIDRARVDTVIIEELEVEE